MADQEQLATPEVAQPQERGVDRVDAKREALPNFEQDAQEVTALAMLAEKLPPDDPAQEAVAKVMIGARIKFPRLPKSLYGIVASVALWGNVAETTSSKPATEPAKPAAVEQSMPAKAAPEAVRGPVLTPAEHAALLTEVARAAQESQKILERLRSFKERQREKELERLATEAKAYDEKMLEQYVSHHLQELSASKFSAEAIKALFDEVFQKSLPQEWRQDSARASQIWTQLEDGMKKMLSEKYDKEAAQGMYEADVLSPHEVFTRATENKDPETLDMVMSELFAGQGKFQKGDTVFQIERMLGDMGERTVDLGYFDKVFEAMPEERRANWALMLKESVVDPALEAAQNATAPDPETTMSAAEEERYDQQRAQDQGISYEKFQELQKEEEQEKAEEDKKSAENIKKLQTIVAKYIPATSTAEAAE